MCLISKKKLFVEELGALEKDNKFFMWIKTRNLTAKIVPLIWLRSWLFEVLNIMLNRDAMFHAHLLREWA